MFPLVLLLLALCVQQLVAVNPVVDLGYAKYRGVNQEDGLIRWQGMRYARSVSRIDGRRFAAPEDPVPERMGSIVDANQFGPICIGTYYDLKNEFGEKQSEDCLFANVWAPANAKNTSALPVYVFIQGGGFNDNGNANYNASKLIKAAADKMVVVNFNYRVGPYGFLASKEIAANKSLSLNNGLKDQRQLLKWVQTHISQFGGDPKHVTLGGASAGGGSVVLQLTAFGGRDDKLFHAIAAESPAFPPMRNVTDSQFSYDALLKKTGCKDLRCLQDLDAVSFQNAVRNLRIAFPGGSTVPIYFWNPTLDYDFIKDYTYNEIKAGHFVKVPTIFGDTTNEGWVFTPKSITSQHKAAEFVANQFVNLDKQEQKRIKMAWQGPPDIARDTRWRNVASDIYGHIRYTCGTLNITAAYAANGSFPVYQYRWDVGRAWHVGEIGSIWNNGTSASGVFMQGYFASFIRSYDPNKHVVEYVSGSINATSPTWEQFGTGTGRRMLLSNNDIVEMEDVSADDRTKCELITSMGVQLEQTAPTSPATRISPFLSTSWTWALAYVSTIFFLGQLFAS